MDPANTGGGSLGSRLVCAYLVNHRFINTTSFGVGLAPRTAAAWRRARRRPPAPAQMCMIIVLALRPAKHLYGPLSHRGTQHPSRVIASRADDSTCGQHVQTTARTIGARDEMASEVARVAMGRGCVPLLASLSIFSVAGAGAHDKASPKFMGLASLGWRMGIFCDSLYSVFL